MNLIGFFFNVAILSFSPLSQKTAAAPSIEDTPMTGRQLSLQAVSTVVEETAKEKEVSKAQGGSKVRSPDPSDDVKSEEEREETDDDKKQELGLPEYLPVDLLPHETKNGQLSFTGTAAEPKKTMKLESKVEKLKEKEVNWFDHSKIDTEMVKKKVLPFNVGLSQHAGSALKINFVIMRPETRMYFCKQDVLHAQDVVKNFNGSKTDSVLTLEHIAVVEQHIETEFEVGSGMRITKHAPYLVTVRTQFHEFLFYDEHIALSFCVEMSDVLLELETQ
ncbi:unnamed protein product [Cylicocyclus nassatus]|uniref:Uncharacterized protein n=1 Tax=Cylicocyclus nassatus TaxID=53992 RepID=A0AA36DRN6_CYLNA|nr:unnamed protein product [Cylicocyclus nassatus]